MSQRTRSIAAALCLILVLALAVQVSYQSGLARRVFFEVFALVKGVEVLGPTTVRIPPSDSPYEHWLREARQHVPMHESLVIEDIYSLELRPWPEMGESVSGLYLRFADYQVTDGRLLSLPPGASTHPRRHLYEAGVYSLGLPAG